MARINLNVIAFMALIVAICVRMAVSVDPTHYKKLEPDIPIDDKYLASGGTFSALYYKVNLTEYPTALHMALVITRDTTRANLSCFWSNEVILAPPSPLGADGELDVNEQNNVLVLPMSGMLLKLLNYITFEF